MAKRKEAALKPENEEHRSEQDLAAAEKQNASAEMEEVLTEENPVGQRVPTEAQEKNRNLKAAGQEEPQPALQAASRRSSNERKQDMENYVAARNLRQEDAVTIAKYISAQRRNNVLSGKIAGVELRGEHAFWVIYEGPVVVMIPYQDALPFFSPEDTSMHADLVRQRQLLTKSVGATIPFSVELIEHDEHNDIYLVYGSRKTAMERIRNRYFGKDAPKPVKVGDNVTGTFLAVGAHAAWLTVNGLDVRMIPRQLSHKYMDNLEKVYKPGDEVELRIQKIEMTEEGPKMVLSALPCELESCKSRLGRIRRGNRYVATVTSHRVVDSVNPRTKRKEPYYVAAMWLEDVELAAFATMTTSHEEGIAHSGDRVIVQVDQIADSGYVRCRIISYLQN